MHLGVKKAQGDVILFVDGDIVGLTHKGIANMLRPLQKKTHSIVIGCASKQLDRMFVPISGIRAYFREDISQVLPEVHNKGYGIELFLNYTFCDQKTAVVYLKGVSHVLKHKKQSYSVATQQFVREVSEISREIFFNKNPFIFFHNAYLKNFYIKREF